MKLMLTGLALGVSLCAPPPLVMRAQADDTPPAWAYAVNPPDFKVQPDDGTLRHVPDSTAAFTVTQASRPCAKGRVRFEGETIRCRTRA
jgi:hypothetical protein